MVSLGRSKGYRRAIAAAGITILWLSGHALAETANPRPQAADQHDSSAGANKPQPAPPVSPVTIEISPADGLHYRAADTAGSHDEGHKPFWRLWEFWTAVGTIFLGIATIGLVWKTDGLIQSAERTAKRQLRAYVFPDVASLLDGSLADPPIQALINLAGAQTVVKNSGQTPAYSFVHWSDVRVIDAQDEDTALPIPHLEARSKFALPPGGATFATRRIRTKLSPGQVQGIRARTHGLYAFGRVEYTDAFGEEHWSNYRLVFNGRWPPERGDTFSFANGGNDSDQDPTK